jgi:tryptophan 2-monooxygenase
MSYMHNIAHRRLSQTRRRISMSEDKDWLQHWLPYPYIDTLYDHTKFLSPTQPIASFPVENYPVAKVAVIGAGAGGMVAAYELLRAGVQPVVIEATDRIGGRTWSEYFEDQNDSAPPVWAEMGAMRVPLSQKLFWYYADQFGAQKGNFPDPGVAPTLLYYQNQPYEWRPADSPINPPPGPFTEINKAFAKYAMRYALKIWEPWYNHGGDPDWDKVREIWQGYIDQYREMSVYDAMRKGIRSWGDEQLNAFSALGVGSGGFGTLYRVSNLELLRNVINEWEVGQQLIVGWKDANENITPTGINGLTQMFYKQLAQWPSGQTVSLESLNAVKFKSKVTRIERHKTSQQFRVYWIDKATNQECTDTFAAVIVAVSTRSMEIDIGMTLPTGNEVDLGSENIKDALRNLFHTASSKMLIRTASKFWLDGQGNPRADIPQSIQTDELPRGIYCLDYPHTTEGVVIVSYTWGDDSSKISVVEPGERFRKFKEVLERICPPFAENLIPKNGERDILNVDWEMTEHYYGAFKLQLPGQDHLIQAAYYHFLNALDPASDPGVYLVGDSVSWSGGWVEGALQTGVNAACAVAKRLGGSLSADSPLSQNPNLYQYTQ